MQNLKTKIKEIFKESFKYYGATIEIFETELDTAIDKTIKLIEEQPFDLYSMKLHDTAKLYGHINVVRVPGGWIYETTHELSSTTTFVPIPNNLEFNNEKPNPIRVDTDRPISKTESLN